MVVLQVGAGFLFVYTPSNPLLATFTVLIGFLLWFRFIGIVILVSAAWIAVAAGDRDVPLRSPEDRRAMEQAALVIAAQVGCARPRRRSRCRAGRGAGARGRRLAAAEKVLARAEADVPAPPHVAAAGLRRSAVRRSGVRAGGRAGAGARVGGARGPALRRSGGDGGSDRCRRSRLGSSGGSFRAYRLRQRQWHPCRRPQGHDRVARRLRADIVALQEVRATAAQLAEALPGWQIVNDEALQKGRAGSRSSAGSRASPRARTWVRSRSTPPAAGSRPTSTSTARRSPSSAPTAQWRGRHPEAGCQVALPRRDGAPSRRTRRRARAGPGRR